MATFPRCPAAWRTTPSEIPPARTRTSSNGSKSRTETRRCSFATASSWSRFPGTTSTHRAISQARPSPSTRKYKCRVLTGGSDYRNGDTYAGGTPTNNEWDRFITREEVISGLPAPVSSDLDNNQNSTDFNSAHNKFWNWFYVYSWCQEVYADNASYRVRRGYYSARRWGYRTASYRNPDLGFRPVLEVLNTDPLISDSDRNLGDKNTNFTIEYTVDDADSGDVLTATESLDGQTTKSFAPTRNSKMSFPSRSIRSHSAPTRSR